MSDHRQYVLGNKLGLGDVGIAGEDERADADLPVGLQFRHNLVGIPHDGRPRPAPSASDAGPQVGFGKPVCVCLFAKYLLAAYAHRRSVE